MRPHSVDSGYVGELFPVVIEGNHGSKDEEGKHAGAREGLQCWFYDDLESMRTLDVRGCESQTHCNSCAYCEQVGTWRRRERNGHVVEEFVPVRGKVLA